MAAREGSGESARRPHIFSAEGQAALTQLLQQRALLAFDFDGTLAPIVTQPAQARLSQAVAARLAALATRLPVAVIRGRSLADLRQRTGLPVKRAAVGRIDFARDTAEVIIYYDEPKARQVKTKAAPAALSRKQQPVRTTD